MRIPLLSGLAARLRARPESREAAPGGAGAALADSLHISAHCRARFVERGPRDAQRGDPEAALRRLIATRGRAVERPPSWFRGRRSGSEFFIAIGADYVIPVGLARPGQLMRRSLRPYVATTFVARRPNR